MASINETLVITSNKSIFDFIVSIAGWLLGMQQDELVAFGLEVSSRLLHICAEAKQVSQMVFLNRIGIACFHHVSKSSGFPKLVCYRSCLKCVRKPFK